MPVTVIDILFVMTMTVHSADIRLNADVTFAGRLKKAVINALVLYL